MAQTRAFTAPDNSPRPSRREFLYYLSAGSAALTGAGLCGLLYQYITRDVPLEQRQDVYPFAPEHLPAQQPVYLRDAAAWMSRGSGGLLALDARCPFDRVVVVWVEVNHRFECPKCGSKYLLDGSYIEGPATHGLGRFGLRVRTSSGQWTASLQGEPLATDEAAQILIDTSVKIPGPPPP